MIVVDASAVIDFVTKAAVRDRLTEVFADHDLFAPSILPMECASALWRLDRTGHLSPEQSIAAVEAIAEWPVTSVDTQRLVSLAWRHRHAVRISDAFYVACAETLSAPLLTSDRRLARAVSSIDVWVA